MKKKIAGLIAALLLGGASAANATVITIDNLDVGFSTSGSWITSVAVCCVAQAIGTNYLVDTPNSPGDSANWDPTGSGDWMAGLWKVEMNWTEFSNRATAALVTINTGLGTLTVNQTGNGGVWNDLGTYTFAATGSSVKIDDSNSARNQFVIADAVRFSRVPEPTGLALLGLGLAGLGWSRRKA